MATITREIRTIRIEDWNGNIYRPEGVGSGGGGSTTNPGDIRPDPGTGGGGGSITPDNMNSTQGSITTDTEASSGESIVIVADPSKDKNVATVIFDNMTFGKVAVSMRLKSSIGSGTKSILKCNVYYVDITETNPTKRLSSTIITANQIGVANKYVDVGFVTEFSGKYTSNMACKIELLVLKNTGATITLDSITSSKAFTALTGSPTVLG